MEKLIAKRDELMEEIRSMVSTIETETRAFTEEELEGYNSKKKEIETLNATIKAHEERAHYTEIEKKKEARTLAQDIQDLVKNPSKELEIGQRNMSHVFDGTANTGAVGTGNSATNVIAKNTYANYILEKLPYISPLYAAIRKERLGTGTHQIPIQSTKLGKFVPMRELQEYAKQVATFDKILLNAHKYGTLISFSEEMVADTGYDIEAELLRQLMEGYGITLDELMVKGDDNVDGLDKFDNTDESTKITLTGAYTADMFIDIFFALPIRYRNNGVWVISDVLAKELTKLKDGEGRPLLTESYNMSPFGTNTMLLGRPCIISEHITTKIYFGDLSRALIIGERSSLMLQKSIEYGFLTDEIGIKANVRFDVKKAISEAMVVATLPVPQGVAAKSK